MTTASAAMLPSSAQAAGKKPDGMTAKVPFLLSPTIDFMMIGGLSLLMFVIAYLYVDKNANTNQISWAAFYLAFAVNNPHFMASYCLLYWDKRHELLQHKRFIWAGIIAPTLVIGYMLGCIGYGSAKYLSYAVNLMFFTVGWHYVKQIYGTMIVTSARRGYYFTTPESWVLRANMYPVWFMSFISGNLGIREIMHYGVGYHTFAMPEWTMMANNVLLAVSLTTVTAMVFRKWIREGKLPGPSAIASFAAIYVWYLPGLYHALFWYMIPFFHSLQYMLFVTALKKNQYTAEAATAGKEAADRRMLFAKWFFGFATVIGVMALLTFKLIPEWLDAGVLHYDTKVFGTQLAMFCFITFINIHHYFIDNVIWRRENQALRQYL